MERDKQNTFLQNIFYISSLAHFNTQRLPPLLKFYEFSLKSGMILNKIINLEDIRKFCIEDKELGKKKENMKKELMETYLLTLPGNLNINWNLTYAVERYNHLDKIFEKEIGFQSNSLTFIEKSLLELILAKASFSKANDGYKFKSKEEYADSSFFVEPTKVFQNNWSNCIVTSEKEILEQYSLQWSNFENLFRNMSSIEYKVDSQEELTKLILEDGKKVLESLCLNPETQIDSMCFFIKPVIKFHDEFKNETFYIVPFPNILCSMTQLRIDNHIQSSEKLRTEDEREKGKITEFSTHNILSLFPHKNIIKNFRYRIGENTYENDVLMILDDSIWILEIKSHPILKKIPFEIEKIPSVFVSKVNEALEQGERALEFLDKNEELLFNLNCNKKFADLIKGVIVVLDGFVPTLLSQNKKFDEMVGTDKIYENVSAGTRVHVLTLLDLYLLAIQPDKENFEEFLKWRTGYLGRFPIVSFDESEYWAFFNNDRLYDSKYMQVFQKLLEKENTLFYTSSRFTNKDYLDELTRKDNKK